MVRYAIKNFSGQHKKAMGKIAKKINVAGMKGGVFLEGEIKKSIGANSYDTGRLASSINTQSNGRGNVRVGTNLVYGLVIEHGRKPGTYPNFDALVGRTARKGMISGGATSQYDDLSSSDKGTIFVIARKIAIKGTEKKELFKKTLKKSKSKILSIIKNELRG